MNKFLIPKAPVPFMVFNDLVRDFVHIFPEPNHLVSDKEADGGNNHCNNNES